jgi:hypothetical protein
MSRLLAGCGKTVFARETGGKGEMSETRGFEVRSSMFSELRTLNFESRLSRTSCLSRSRFTRKNSGSAIAAETFMNNAG